MLLPPPSPALTQAEEWLASGIAAMGLPVEEVKRLPGGNAWNVAMARLLWERRTVGQGWIAERLGMGSAANVSQQIRRDKAQKKWQKLPHELRQLIDSVKI